MKVLSIVLGYNFREALDENKLYKTVIDTGAPETILPYTVRQRLGKRVGTRNLPLLWAMEYLVDCFWLVIHF